MAIRCPHCGSPVMIRGNRWECGYCGDFGSISSSPRVEPLFQKTWYDRKPV